MKKKLFSLILTVVMAAGLMISASAENLTGAAGWNVTLTDGSKLSSNFSSSDITDAVSGLQPGDDITFTINVANENQQSADWYISNAVISSLEDASSAAAGGAYGYELVYTGTSGERVLFSSETVGGEDTSNGEGLHEAGMDGYVYLDTLAAGQTGTVSLKVSLDGESQGNGYQSTFASLQIQFAVEIAAASGSQSHTKVVQTGDSAMPVAAMICMMAAGVNLLVVAIVSVKTNKKAKEAAVHENR